MVRKTWKNPVPYFVQADIDECHREPHRFFNEVTLPDFGAPDGDSKRPLETRGYGTYGRILQPKLLGL